MGIIKRMFQLNLTQREIVKSKRFMAILMIPIFIFQMSSLNLVLLQVAIAEDGESASLAVEEPKDEPVAEEEDVSAPEEPADEPKEEVQPEEDVVPKEEIAAEDDVKGEEDSVEKEAPSVLDEIVPDSIGEAIVDNVIETPVIPEDKTGNVEEDNGGGRITPEAAYDEIEEPVQTPSAQDSKVEEGWRENSDGSSSIIVTAGSEYEYKDSGLKIKFTRIDSGTGEITVKEIDLTDEQVTKLGALSNKAWDITSSMADGTFEYELTFPMEESVDESKVQLVYAEEKEDLNDENKIKAVEQEDVTVDNEKKELVADGLDHFTIYVATYADNTYTVETEKDVYSQGETVFARATGLINGSSNYYKLDIKNPNNTNASRTTGCNNNVSELSVNYELPNDAYVGSNWQVILREYNKFNCNSQSYVSEQYINFEVVKALKASTVATETSGCIQEAADSNLTCTANDVSIANVSEINILDDGCKFPGDTVEFQAIWDVQSTATERYDIGLYFSSDGDPDGDGALSGSCSVSTLPNSPVPPWFNFDFDACGDISSSAMVHPPISMTVQCLDEDGDNKLDLPYCTSWNQNSGGVCSSPEDAYPGAPSKCNCNDGFEIPITVPYKAQIEVIKDLIPSTDEGKFNLQIDSVDKAANVGDGGTTGKIVVGAGTSENPGATHNVSETAGTGTVLNDYTSSISCVDRGLNTFDGGLPLTFSGTGPLDVAVQKDDDIVCTITNTKKAGHIIVDKVTNPSGDPQSFSFATTGTGYSGFSLTDAAAPNDQTLNAGIYSVAETVPAGWDLISATCVSSIGDTESTSSIELDANETINCTFTNTKKASLTLVKSVTNNNGGTALPSAWTLSASGPTPISGITGSVSVTNALVDIGVYNLSESGGPTGYVASDYSCVKNGGAAVSGNSVTLAAGDNAVCTINNDDQAGTLIVKKEITNDNGGNNVCEDFSFNYGTGAINFEDDCQNEISVPAGTYNVTETPAVGYATTYDNCSSIVVPNGGSATCTIKNDDIAPSLTVIKNVINDDGGNETVDAFGIKMNDNLLSFGAGVSVGDTTTYTSNPTVSANTVYTLSEKDLSGYAEGTWSCVNGAGAPVSHPVTLSEGQNVTCTIINNDIAPTITLVKEVINNNGGTAGVNSFGLSIGGASVNSGQVYAADANIAYAINEVGLSGYEFVSITGNAKCPTVLGGAVTLDEGENITCTIKNDDVAPKLHLRKVINNDNGGSAELGDFTLRAEGSGENDLSGTSPVDSGGTLQADTFILSETGPAGYSAGNWECNGSGTQVGVDITLKIGQEATCTITNDDQTAHLKLVKNVLNDNLGTADAADFTLNASGPTPLSGDGIVESDVDAGVYTLSETTNVTGYEAGSWNCTNGITVNENNQITLALGQTTICTIINNDIQPKLTITKIVSDGPFGDLEVSDFDLYVGATKVVSGVENGFNVGDYVVSETPEDGYQGVISGDCDASGNITLNPGDVKSCTITNTDNLSKIIIEKQTLPDGDTTEFSFSGTGVVSDTKLKDNQTAEKIVAPGAYSVTEIVPTGWDLTDLVCDDANSGVNPTAGNSASINVEANETVKCTFTNTKRGNITIVKDAVSNDAQDFEFENNFGNNNPATFYLDDDGSGGSALSNSRTFEVLPGEYEISEEEVVGWQQESATCDNGETIDSINVEPGENITCTFVNEEYAKITLVKNTIGGDGDFDFDAAGDGLPADIDLTTVSGIASQTFENIDQDNTYSIAENVPAGWVLTSSSCNNSDPVNAITPNPGETVTCTFTNTKDATLTLEKTVINNNGGTATEDDFQGKIDGNDVDWDAAQVVSATLHTVSEVTLPGYTPSSWGGDCAANGTVTLNPGENKTCTITNDDQQAYVVVNKTVNNDDGGNAEPDDFNLTVDDNAVLDEVKYPVDPGIHKASETNLSGYVAGVWGGDCNEDGKVTVALGETKTCTITNDDIAPKLTLVKSVDNGDGGNALPDDFKLTIGGNAATSGIAYTLDANTPYTINETELDGYEFVLITGDEKCPAVLGGTVTLDEGDDITCTITNNDVVPGLTVIKKVINDNGGDEAVDAFEIKMNDNLLYFGAGNTIGDTTSYTATPKVSSNTLYTLSEKDLPGYTEGNWSCKDAAGATIDHPLNLSEGQNVTCEITNDDIAPKLKLSKTVVNDNKGDQTAGDWTLTANGTELGFSDSGDSVNFHNVKAGITYDLSESGPSGYTSSWWSCDGGQASGNTILLEVGEQATCTITNDDIAPKLTLVKSVNNGDGGNALPDDFKLTIGGNAATSGIAYTLDANTPYTINETELDGYEFVLITGDEKCPAVLGGTVTLDEGDDITCTITNDDITPTVTLIKNVIGGIAGVNEFGLSIGGENVNSGIKTNVKANTPIALNEGGLHGYTFTSLTGEGCPTVPGDTVALGEGDDITCTFTNTRDVGSITVNKIIDMDGDLQTIEDQIMGANWQFDVDGTAGDTSDPSANFTGAEGSASFTDLKTGEYTIIETKQAGYDLVVANCGIENGNFDNIDSMDSVSVNKEGNTICNFYNVPNGTIHGYKWDDINGDKANNCLGYDEGEKCKIWEENLLSGWTINLYKSNGEGGFDPEPMRTMVTDSSEEHFGWYWFENLLPGDYKVCEVLQNGWTPIYPTADKDDNCHLITLPDDNSNGFNESRNAVDGPEYNFGNQFINPNLTIAKYNSQWPNIQAPGSIIDYTIAVTALENNVNDVKVTDLLPKGFEYISGSGTASSSLGDGHNGALELTHIYASPGEWSLGNMQPGEVVTLTYKAKIANNQEPGNYKDLAWADGDDDRSARVLAESIPAPTVDPGEITDNFVGTQIEMAVAPIPQMVELEEETDTETKTKKKVLGVTTYLPATGTPNGWIMLALAILISGAGLMFVSRRRSKNNNLKDLTMKVMMLMALGIGTMFITDNIAQAATIAPSIRLEQPVSPTNDKNLDVGFVVLDIDNRPVTVDCYKKGPNDLAAVKFSTVALPAGGSSGVCTIALDVDGNYDLYATASADGDSSDSNSVSVSLATNTPGTPTNYDRDDEGCVVIFNTANDGGLTKKVVLYRSTDAEFIADNSTKVQEGNFESNIGGSLTDPNGNCDDYFYAIQAISEAGIGSDFVGDVDVDTETETKTKTVYEEDIVYTGGGAIPVTEGQITEGATEEGGATQETEGEKAVQGEETEGELVEGAESEGRVAGMFSEKNAKYWWAVGLIALLSAGYYGYRKYDQKNKKLPFDEE